MSPVIQIHVDKVVFDETGNVLHLDMVQTFHIFISLFRPAPARLLTRLQLYHDTDSGLYFIKDQTDFYQPEEIANLVIPPLAILINLFKYIAGLFSGFLAWIFHTLFGWWKPGPNSKEMKQKKM
ncbi:hypothetical protein FRC03_002416 [Tulasnella sp. 419]|nr:hypothetical protein FRC03_002416 [Tulasnella sp. 419]